METMVWIFWGYSLGALLVQFAVLLGATLAHLFQIVHMRRDSVVVVSYAMIFLGCFLGCFATLVLYQGILWLMPAGFWPRFLYWIGAFLFKVPWRVVIQLALMPITRETTLVDTQKSETELYNCNWPLIPRCIKQSFYYLLTFGALTSLWLSRNVGL